MSVCDRCVEVYELRRVLYPIEFEGLTKPLHGCGLVGESGREYTPKQIQLEGILTQIIFSIIGQGDAYLKIVQVPPEIFTEGRRRRIKLSPDSSLIEEKDYIEIELLAKDDKAHWFWRAIKLYCDSDKIKLTRVKGFSQYHKINIRGSSNRYARSC